MDFGYIFFNLLVRIEQVENMLFLMRKKREKYIFFRQKKKAGKSRVRYTIYCEE